MHKFKTIFIILFSAFLFIPTIFLKTGVTTYAMSSGTAKGIGADMDNDYMKLMSEYQSKFGETKELNKIRDLFNEFQPLTISGGKGPTTEQLQNTQDMIQLMEQKLGKPITTYNFDGMKDKSGKGTSSNSTNNSSSNSSNTGTNSNSNNSSNTGTNSSSNNTNSSNNNSSTVTPSSSSSSTNATSSSSASSSTTTATSGNKSSIPTTSAQTTGSSKTTTPSTSTNNAKTSALAAAKQSSGNTVNPNGSQKATGLANTASGDKIGLLSLIIAALLSISVGTIYVLYVLKHKKIIKK